MLKSMLRIACTTALIVVAASCENSHIQPNNPGFGKKSNDDRDRPGGFQQNPGETYSFPEIIEQEFIPSYEYFAGFKCRTWRITWPWIDGDYNADLIPTVLSVNSGELNSFEFLNNNAPSNTYNSTMSLYYQRRVESAGTMWWQLNHSLDEGASNEMEGVRFAKGNVSLESIMNWVQNRPKLFMTNWPGSTENALDYEEGDFIHFFLTKSDQYGGIRIVSMTPRIIEVYLAMPHTPYSK